MRNDPLKAKIAQLHALSAADDATAIAVISKALTDRSNYIIAKAAGIAAERYLVALIPQLLAVFDRLLRPATDDVLGLGKNAVAKALKELDLREPAAFLRGLHYIQLEPAWGAPTDAAAGLRSTCALALVNCDIDEASLLRELVDLLAGDSVKSVRVDVARAIAEVGGDTSILLLRLKVLCGDAEAEVLGECFSALLQREPRISLSFVERFLTHASFDVCFEAACTLAASREPAAQATIARFWQGELSLDLRRGIIFSCAASAAPEASEFLLTIVADVRPEVAVWALSALAASRFSHDLAERARRAATATGNAAVKAAYVQAFEPATAART